MKTIGLAVLLFLILLVLGSSFFVVNEYDQVILTQFGKPVGNPHNTPGLKVKAPFIQRIHRFDRRFLEWDGDPNQLPTRDKRFIHVDTLARWRITDPLLFYQRLRDERSAQTRLDDILDGETRNAIANHDLVELIRSTNRSPEESDLAPEDRSLLDTIVNGREHIRGQVLKNAQARTADLGIEVLDVQFKRINYVQEVQQKVFERMIAERRRIADRFRSEGEGEAQRIRGERERDLKQIESEAYRQAQSVVGRADSLSTRIYAKAYNRSGDTRAFYDFMKTMETYRTTLDAETWLILSTDGDLYRRLVAPEGK
jgi:membrane protease subunit HflC